MEDTLSRFDRIGLEHDIVFSAELVERNPFWTDEDDRRAGATHWGITMRWDAGESPDDTPRDARKLRGFSCVYSMGAALTGPPTMGDVLESLLDDFVSMEDTGGKWDYWETFGIEPSEQAEQHFMAARAQSHRFFDFAMGSLLRELRIAGEDR